MTNANHYPLVLGQTIAGMIVPKVLIDGGAGLNIIFVDTLKKIGLDFTSLLSGTKSRIPEEEELIPINSNSLERSRSQLLFLVGPASSKPPRLQALFRPMSEGWLHLTQRLRTKSISLDP